MPSRRRPQASRSKSVPPQPSPSYPNQNPLFRSTQRELVTKRRGELAELAFTLKAASLGFAVSKPFGDSERYDVIVDARQLLTRNRCHSNCPTLQAAHKKDSTDVETAASAVPRSEASGGAGISMKSPAPARKKSHPLSTRPKLSCPALRVLDTAAPNPWCPLHPVPPLWRVQVKCSTQLVDGLYRLNAHRRTGGRAVPYLPGEIDFLAAYIIPEDTWYIVPLEAFLGSTSLLFRRRADPKPGLYDQFNEAWHLLRPK